MKIAISSTGEVLDSQVDARFGRCSYFVIAEINEESGEIKKTEVVANNSVQQSRGAGTATSEFIGNQKVDAVITGNIGPNSASVMQQLGIDVYQGQGEIKKVLQQFIDKKLVKLGQSNVPKFAGMEGQ